MREIKKWCDGCKIFLAACKVTSSSKALYGFMQTICQVMAPCGVINKAEERGIVVTVHATGPVGNVVRPDAV